MDALFIEQEEYRKSFKLELENAGVPYKEMQILDGELYIVTLKRNEEEVERVYKNVIGTKPSKYSMYFPDATELTAVVRRLEDADVRYDTGEYYGVSYVEWAEKDDTPARKAINQVLGQK